MEKDFCNKILGWFAQNKREMPWRGSANPYCIWISEVILQQTRVEQGIPYYEKFIAKIPTIQDLAAINEEELLSVWQGLGYYSRAFNLKKSAQLVVEKFGGKIPDDWQNILQLPGVGPYTAAAILSIAYGKAYPTIDGNVKRVISRYLGLDLPIDSGAAWKVIWDFLCVEICKDNPSHFNQGLMEIGSMVCTPLAPTCGACPLAGECVAFKNNSWQAFPNKPAKTKVKTVFYNYLVINNPENYLVYKRDKTSIWKGLWEFPLAITEVLSEHLPSFEEWNISTADLILLQYEDIVHILSHRKIYARFWICDVKNGVEIAQNDCVFIKKSEFVNKGITQLVKKFTSMPLVCNN